MAKKKPKKAFAGNAVEPPAPRRVAHESPLQRLVRLGHLSIHEHTAADEIIAGYQLSVGLPVARDPSLGIPRAEARPDAADAGAVKRSDILVAYSAWSADLARETAGIVTVRTLFDELPFREIERMCGLRNGAGLHWFLVGVRHFAALRGNVPRGARGWKWSKEGAA